MKIVASGVNKMRSPERSMIIVTHYQRLLNYIVPDFVHVLVNGQIVKSGDKELAFHLEEKGYDWVKEGPETLAAHLNYLGVDTVIVCGESTSGCVRASVVDGCTYRYRITVVEECVFDRHEAAHAMNLFDMNQKYADVLSLGDVLEYMAAWGAEHKKQAAATPA